jgi:hypothetical protein
MLRYYDTDINDIYNDREDDKSYSTVIIYRTLVLIVFITSIYYYAIHLIFNL